MRAILFSISYEEDFINVVRMLHEAGVPSLRERRGGRPIVIAGGPAVSANPMPLVDIVDAMALGEGEETLGAIVHELEEMGRGEAERQSPGEPGAFLEALARIPGMLVPGHSRAGVGFREPVSPSRFPRSVIITPESAFPDTMLVESGRGCPGACAFCLATALYRPFRFMPLSAFEELAENLHPAVKKIGLVSTAVAANPDFVPIVKLLASRGIAVSFSSLRAEDLDDEKAALVGSIGTASVSLAPESGSERVRFALGKRVADEVYFNAAASLRAAGVAHFTLYLLIGCPGDDDAALAETEVFMGRFRKAIGGRGFSVHVNPLVPKPWTPLQFYAMPEERELALRQRAVERSLRKLGLGVQMKSVRSALRQALFSTGDEADGPGDRSSHRRRIIVEARARRGRREREFSARKEGARDCIPVGCDLGSRASRNTLQTLRGDGAGWIRGGSVRERASDLLDAALDAARANVRPLRSSVDLDAYFLKIWKPPALGQIMSVADIVSGARLLPAYGTNFRHLVSS